jgi:hypothetical protein
MIALNMADFDLTEGIEHYFRLAVSIDLCRGYQLMIVRHGGHCLRLYQSCDTARKRLMGVVSTSLCIPRIGCCVSFPLCP